MSAESTLRRGIPDATVARLPDYLRALTSLAEAGVTNVSSGELAETAGVRPAGLRKDLSHLGSYGVRGVGYDVKTLMLEISQALGLTQRWAVAIVGMGNLGRALAAYGGFTSAGFRIAALLDHDPGVVGERVAGLAIEPVAELERIVAQRAISIGVIAAPAASAQEVADRLVAAGVGSLLNFAPTMLLVPETVDVRRVDLATELQILAFHEQRKLGGAVTLETGGIEAGGIEAGGIETSAIATTPVGVGAP